MNIEIVEFYPTSLDQAQETLIGTLRIKLSDFGIHILGIQVSKRKNLWHFRLPARYSTHHETGEQIFYPLIAFDYKEQQQTLMVAIREKGRAFIEKRLADTERRLVIPPKKQKQPKPPQQAQLTIETTQIPIALQKAKSSSRKSIIAKPFDFVDPPFSKKAQECN